MHGLSREGGWQSVSKRGSLTGSSQGKEDCLGKVYQKEEVRLAQVKGRRVVWAKCIKKRKLDWLELREGGLFGQGVSKRQS